MLNEELFIRVQTADKRTEERGIQMPRSLIVKLSDVLSHNEPARYDCVVLICVINY